MMHVQPLHLPTTPTSSRALLKPKRWQYHRSNAADTGESEQQQIIVADANAAWLLKRERRCDQKGRGSIYDNTAGIIVLEFCTCVLHDTQSLRKAGKM